MNHCMYDLFQNDEKRNRFAKGLPKAFDIVRKRMPNGNPAVGLLREHVIIGFFEAAFGQARIEVPEDGTKRGYDVLLCGEKLSIKTRTNVGGFKVLWTVDNEYVRKEIKEGYFPESDILLVNIHWNTKRDSAFFIPVDVQEKVLEYYGRKNYLSSSTGSNNRGIGIQGVQLLYSEITKTLFQYQLTGAWMKQTILHPGMNGPITGV